jgi:surfactin synthase thioesterase subunit
VTTVATASWLVRLSPVREQTVRLVCLPHAGGGSSTFRPLSGALPAWVDVLAARLPGRESRRREAPVLDLDVAVSALLDELRVAPPLPTAMFGYCSGALLAHELAVRMSAEGRAPSVLFACASQAPHDYGRNRGVHAMSRAELVAYLRGMNVMPASILDNADLFDLFESAIRADFAMFETTNYRPTEALAIPLVAMGARGDSGVLFEDLIEWRHTGSGQFAVHMFTGGGHGFLTSAPATLASVVSAALAANAPAASTR